MQSIKYTVNYVGFVLNQDLFAKRSQCENYIMKNVVRTKSRFNESWHEPVLTKLFNLNYGPFWKFFLNTTSSSISFYQIIFLNVNPTNLIQNHIRLQARVDPTNIRAPRKTPTINTAKMEGAWARRRILSRRKKSR